MRKRRTRAHVIADLSAHHVEGFVLRCGWTVERTRHDYGIDLMMRTYSDNGEAETGAVYMQLKATDSLPWVAAKHKISLRLQWRDLLFWLNEPMPVILIVYDAAENKAYWLNVQDYFRGQNWEQRAATATTAKVHIPADNIVNEEAIRQFARFRDEYTPRK